VGHGIRWRDPDASACHLVARQVDGPD